jgi:hypothetical protein
MPAPLSVQPRAVGGAALEVEGEAGPFLLHDRWEWRGARLWVWRRWTYPGAGPRAALVLGTRVPTGCGPEAQVTLPGVSYNGNPAADPRRLVPRLEPRPGSLLVVEEHRLPVPGVTLQWPVPGGRITLGLLAVPEPILLAGAGPDHWWSLGGQWGERGLDLLSLSGVVALHGARDTIYAAQNVAAPVPDFGYLQLQPGDTLSKTLVLEPAADVPEGQGFRHLVRAGWEVLRPQTQAPRPLAQTIALKAHALERRWRAADGGGGFLVAPASRDEGNIYDRGPGFLFGWTGQSLRLAWCALALGEIGADPEWQRRGRAVLDTFARAPELAGAPGLRPMYYALDEGRWYADGRRQRERFSSRMLGENLSHLADCLLLLQTRRRSLSPEWTGALQHGLTFLASAGPTNADGVFPVFFDGQGRPTDALTTAAGLPAVVALLQGAALVGEPALAARGLELLERYEDLFAVDFKRPFSRSTLDAACEDKEAGLYFFLAAYHAFGLTDAPRWADAACRGAEWAATFVYCWDAAFPPGSPCARQGLRTSGWSSVSVQNHHIDVFFFPWEIHALGQRLDDGFLRDLGQATLHAFSQGIAESRGAWGYPTPGEQGEAFFQTNWSTDGSGRGGFNRWNPSWIIASVLQPTLRAAHPELVPG